MLLAETSMNVHFLKQYPRQTCWVQFPKLILAICFMLFACISVFAQCANGEIQAEIIIIADSYPQETSWTIATNNVVLAAGDVEGGLFCLPSADCMVFSLFDNVGDGICCGYGEGSYNFLIDGDTIATGGEFADREQAFFNCPSGSICSAAEEIAAIGSYTTEFEDHWYLFNPDTSGIFQFSTCSWEDCGTKIWIYDYCIGLDWDDTQEAAIYYGNGSCGGGLNAFLEGALLSNDDYWIRIAANENCSSQEVLWSLDYTGPAQGCIDTNACNYDPFALLMQEGSCIYPGDPGCPNGPDLLLVEEVLRESLQLGYRENDDQCFVEEGCLSGYGERTVLRFTTHIENIGNQDFFIGQPPASQAGESDQWEYDPCHGHWHYEGYARYLLYDAEGNELPAGFKNGFCVMDLDCSYGGGTAKYGCGNQGISAQCGDIYDSNLDCQWIDLTDFPAGLYTLVVTVNWNQSPDAAGRHETDWTNNWMQACFSLNYDSSGQPFMNLLEDCDLFTDCAGVIQGSAQPDCKGDCAGSAVRGDANGDLELTEVDRMELLNKSMNTTEVSNCLDLNDDGLLTATDAALMQFCLNNDDDPLENHCDFPYTITNINDTVSIGIHSIDLEAEEIFLSIRNATCEIVALQFVLSGIVISDIEQTEGKPMDYAFDADGQISILMPHELLSKSNEPQIFLKVSYNQINQPFARLDQFVASVNEMREEVLLNIDEQSFIYLYEATKVEEDEQYELAVAPNPFRDQVSFELKNGSGTYDLRIFDLSGQLVQEVNGIDTDKYTLMRSDLASGTYFYEVIAERRFTGKILAE